MIFLLSQLVKTRPHVNVTLIIDKCYIDNLLFVAYSLLNLQITSPMICLFLYIGWPHEERK